MRLSLILLLVALAGVLGGGALIGLPALGGCLIFDSLALGAWALFADDGVLSARDGHVAPTMAQIFDRERARAS